MTAFTFDMFKSPKIDNFNSQTVTSAYPLFYQKVGFFLLKKIVLELTNSQTLLSR